MTETKKGVIGLSVFFAIVGVGLVVGAIASDHWIISDLRGNETDRRTESAKLTLGLFNGEMKYRIGLGDREAKLELKCDLSESICGYVEPEVEFDKRVKEYKNGTQDLVSYALFGFPLFATNLVMLCLSMVFGLLAIGFSIFNVFGRPIETITGVGGLYLWNAMGLIFVLIGIGVYMGLFFSQLCETVLNIMVLLKVEGTIWQDDTKFDYSFYFVVGSAGAYLLNIVVLLLGSGKACSCSYAKSGEKEVDNGMILY